MNKSYYIGLDVHSEKNAIAHALEGSREEATYYGKCGGSVPNTEVTLRRLAKKLGVHHLAAPRSVQKLDYNRMR